MDYEIQLVACCLLDNTLIAVAVWAGIQPDWFTNEWAKKVWTEMVKRVEDGKTADVLWADGLMRKSTGECEPVFLDATNNILSVKSELMTAVEIMEHDYLRREVLNILNSATRNLQDEDPRTIACDAASKLMQLEEDNHEQETRDVEERIIGWVHKGIECPTGFPQLDYLVKGLEPGVLWVVGGHTSNGKTTFVLNLAYNLAKRSNCVTYCSTEMSHELIIRRLTTMISGVNPSITPSLPEEAKEAYIEALPSAITLPIEISSTLSLSEIRMTIRRKRSRLYIVDYIQMISTERKFDSEVKKLGYIVRELERLSKDYNVCIVATSQFSRPKDDVPSLWSYRGSGEIEENTDIGILLYYPYQQVNFKEQQELEDKGKDKIINLAVKKNRIHGLTGIIKFAFDPQTMRMEEMGPEE